MDSLKKVLIKHDSEDYVREGVLDENHNVVYVNSVSSELLASFGWKIEEISEENKDVSVHGCNSR